MDKITVQRLVGVRVQEARTLFAARLYSGAYYLAGYSVELGLKAIIIKQFRTNLWPNRNTVSNAYTHDLNTLIRLAGLQQGLDNEIKNNINFARNWAIVRDWTEEKRYEIIQEAEARDMIDALTTRNGGILRWIRLSW